MSVAMRLHAAYKLQFIDISYRNHTTFFKAEVTDHLTFFQSSTV